MRPHHLTAQCNDKDMDEELSKKYTWYYRIELNYVNLKAKSLT